MFSVEAQKPPPGQWTTVPFDPRFPNQNQSRNCYQNFLGETGWDKLEGNPRPSPPETLGDRWNGRLRPGLEGRGLHQSGWG